MTQSNSPIRRVAVLGAGVMGSGIAAHLANAGVPVLLCDIVPAGAQSGGKSRNALAAGAVQKMLAHKPAPFSHKSHARLIEVGNLEDDLGRMKDFDLVIEAVIEQLPIKRALFEKLEKITDGTDAIIASNTSGLRLRDLTEGRSESFRKRFLVTHFFNPPRYLKLLELVRSPDTDDAVVARLERFGADVLGKGIVFAKDTPNFIANRIGAHSLMGIIHLMLEHGLAPEDIDALTGVPMGHPKSATFRTADVVGLDTLVHVVDNCKETLTEDEDRAVFEVPPFIRKMVADKLLGEKTKSGFYKKTPAGIATLDPGTGEYRAKGGDKAIRNRCKDLAEIEDPRQRVRKLVASEGKVGEIAWKALSRSLAYSARRVGEISDDVASVDDAMRWGYNWELGPFETWDALGFVETTERMQKEGLALPESIRNMQTSGATSFYTADGRVFDLKTGKYVARSEDPRAVTLDRARRGEAVLSNGSAEAWDLGDGVLGVTFKSKANTLDADNINLLHDAITRAEQDFRGMLIFNRGDNFGLGANLFLVMGAAAQKQWNDLSAMVERLQTATQRMKYAAVPVVAAPFGMALGGGFELCLASASVQAALETYPGLVEAGVGLIPGGAGNLNLLWRALEGVPEGAEVDTYALVTQVFKNIAMANVATSAHEAKALGYFRHSDGVSFDRGRHLHEAKQRVIGLADTGYRAPQPRAYRLPGESGIATLRMMINTLVAGGFASEHDAKIGAKLANVLCGGVSGNAGEVTEDRMLELEREAFVSLCGEPKTQERIQYTLMNNAPLRN
jgi:3-hydroxyacyl-CoA dehydrogenase